MLPPGGSICGRLTQDLPLGCLQSGHTCAAFAIRQYHIGATLRRFSQKIAVQGTHSLNFKSLTLDPTPEPSAPNLKHSNTQPPKPYPQPQPPAPNPQPPTPKPQPSALKRKPSTLSPKAQTQKKQKPTPTSPPNPQLPTPSLKPSTLSLKAQTPNPHPSALKRKALATDLLKGVPYKDVSVWVITHLCLGFRVRI